MNGGEQYRVGFRADGKRIEVAAARSGTLLDLVRAEPALSLPAPCGGSGLCGKCRVRILSDPLPPPAPEDRLLFSPDALAKGWRLACRLTVDRNMEVYIPSRNGGILARTDSAAAAPAEGNPAEGGPAGTDPSAGGGSLPRPAIRKEYRELPHPSLDDQRDDLSRVLDGSAGGPQACTTDGPQGRSEAPEVPLTLLRNLPRLLPETEYRVTLVRDGNRLLAVEPGDTTGECYGIAVDIGTTTLVVYLADLRTGAAVDVASAENPQAAWGADVISRIGHAADPAVLRELGDRVAGALDSMIGDLAGSRGIPRERIYGGTIAGNTTMLHLLAGVPPERMAAAPFIPAFTRSLSFRAAEAGIAIHPQGRLRLLPSISAYVGGDITAGVLASGMHREERTSLLIDIGTNGEIVLGNRDGLLCCSTAAGPAFEGAHIRCGIGGVPGAVSRAVWNGRRLVLETIRGAAPTGICGSGIVDLAALLLDLHLADETGRLLPRSELPADVPEPVASRVIDCDGAPAFLAVPAEQSASGEPLILTQRDFREIQLAKAAIAAGIRVLLGTAGLDEDAVSTVHFAGGFGSWIDVASAARIGLFPAAWRDRVRVLGNTAGAGALLTLLHDGTLAEAQRIAASTRYVELSSIPAFQQDYIELMLFP